MFFYEKEFYQRLMVNDISKSTPCSGSSDHNSSAPHSDALHHAFLWATKFLLPPLQGSVLQYSPLPPADLGPNSLVLIQRKADPSGGRRVDLGQSLQEWAGGQAEAGNPSISLSPSLCRSPPPLPTGTWSHAELHSGVPEKEGEKTGVFIL